MTWADYLFDLTVATGVGVLLGVCLAAKELQRVDAEVQKYLKTLYGTKE